MTSYETIYDRFLRKIESYGLVDLEDEEIEEYCNDLLISAFTKLPDLTNDLSDGFNSDSTSFTADLTYDEIEALACMMVAEWIDKYLNTEQLLNMFVGTSEESMASQANHMKYLIELQEKQVSKANQLMRDTAYRSWIRES